MEKKGAFDYILLETTGLADPGNIAPLFWVDDGLGSTIYLDGIVTLVDAKNILRSLDDPSGSVGGPEQHDHKGPLMTTAHVQISHADFLVINKADLVSEDELRRVRNRIESINGLAKVHVTENSVVPQLEGFLLDLHAYDRFEEYEAKAKGHSHLDPVSGGGSHSRRPRRRLWLTTSLHQAISTICVSVPRIAPRQLDDVDRWLRSVLWDSTVPGSGTKGNFEIHRSKGRIVLENEDIRILQGVREVFELTEPPIPPQSQPASGKIILIGRNIANVEFQGSFEREIGCG